jgi:hypothetical protein
MSGGGSTSSGDTRFERKGTASTTSFRSLTPAHEGLFSQGFAATTPGAANAGVDQMLSGRINAQVGSRPYAPELCNVIRSSLPNQSSPAEGAMSTMANRDIYSGNYEQNTFNRYAEEVQKAMAQSRSGPQMTRGGTAAQGYAQSQAVNDMALNREQVLTQNRNVDANIAQGATGMMANNRHMMNSDAIQGAQVGQAGFAQFLQNQMAAGGLASERTKMFNDLVPTYATLGSVMNGTESNNLSGRGAQSSTSFGGGFNLCCFIFMEAYNGVLPWWVRECRDDFAPENTARRKGYIRMSKWLVPAMRINGLVRKAVNHLLILPLTRWGAVYKGVSGWKTRWCDGLLKNAWFKLWELTGKESA